jgi:hypothetical protein
MLMVLIELDTATTAITCSVGRVMRCSGRWMRGAVTISAASWRGRVMRMR